MGLTPTDSANRIDWRGIFESAEVNAFYAEFFRHQFFQDDWWSQVNRHSLGGVCIRHLNKQEGFVNVAWNGNMHALILNSMGTSAFQRRGVAEAMIAEASARARRIGCQWLHVDFDLHLRQFYFNACGFKPTDIGLITLK